MNEPVYVSSHVPVKVPTSDRDIARNGDSLTFIWSTTAGSITGSGDSVTYHAPASPALSVQIKVVVKDKGGHVVEQVKFFDVIQDLGGCPALYVLKGDLSRGNWYKQDLILTESEDPNRTNLVVNDIIPLEHTPDILMGHDDDLMYLYIREDENETSYLDNFRLAVLDMPQESLKNYVTTTDGRLAKIVAEIEPERCLDGNGADHTAEVRTRDAVFFRSLFAGELRLTFNLGSSGALAKVTGGEATTDGGTSAPPPPKADFRVSAAGQAAQSPNLLAVEVLSPLGSWVPIGKIAPRHKKTNRLLSIPAVLSYLRNSKLTIRLRWSGVYAADKISFYLTRPIDPALIKELPLRWASLGGWREDLTAKLTKADGDFAILRPGDTVSLGFAPIWRWPYPDIKKFPFVLFARGYDTSALAGANFTALPENSELLQNSPNPFNANTTIRFKLAGAEKVNLSVFNLLGQKVATLVDELLLPGEHSVEWDGRDKRGRELSSGIYFYKLTAGKLSATKKLILLK
jgi:hypothetical protein